MYMHMVNALPGSFVVLIGSFHVPLPVNETKKFKKRRTAICVLMRTKRDTQSPLLNILTNQHFIKEDRTAFDPISVSTLGSSQS